MKKTLTSESVTEGHPDKVCDQISDALLDEFLRKDMESHVAIECMATTGAIIVSGEVKSEAYVNIEKTVRDVLRNIGYTKPEYGIDCHSCAVMNMLKEQSPDIAQGVSNRRRPTRQGAGDQGMVYGYACSETRNRMPQPLMLAHGLAERLSVVRKKGLVGDLRPDGKSQVTMEYDEFNNPTRIESIILAVQHDENWEADGLYYAMMDAVIDPICHAHMDDNTKIVINGTGRFVKGGPEADTGLTGRKIIVDTYGGAAHHGGGAFSGKDPSKVDRSGAYAARQLAKSIVYNDFADRCEVGISYAIGKADPTSISIETFGTEIETKEFIDKWARKVDLTPYGIIKRLRLKRPIYKETACYGHFGREQFPWEKVI